MIFNLINDLEFKTKKETEIYYKPHPVNAPNKFKFNGIKKICSNEKISKLLKNYDLAICGSTTTAALECYLSGKELAVILEKNSPILSPVYNLPHVNFIENSYALEKVISSYQVVDYSQLRISNIFNLDNKLTRWVNFLNNE